MNRRKQAYRRYEYEYKFHLQHAFLFDGLSVVCGLERYSLMIDYRVQRGPRFCSGYDTFSLWRGSRMHSTQNCQHKMITTIQVHIKEEKKRKILSTLIIPQPIKTIT